MSEGPEFIEDLLGRITLGQISASLAALNRTIDDYDSMAKREMIKAKQEKAYTYVLSFHFAVDNMHD